MLGLVYSALSYVAFLAIFVYFALVSDGLLVPKGVDSGSATPLAVALTINLGLLLVLGVQHSVMARPQFESWLTRLVPVHLERATYVMFSNLALGLLMWQWRPLHAELWHIESRTLAAPLWAINALGWLGVPACSFVIDHFNLFGLKSALAGFRQRTLEQAGFVAWVAAGQNSELSLDALVARGTPPEYASWAWPLVPAGLWIRLVARAQ